MIELYIENKKIELEDELEIDISYETIDPNKLASIKNSFSKTVKVPGTPNNNITFGHIFRNDKYIPVNIPGQPIDSFYDPHRKVTWIINKNGAIVQRGYCTLDSVDIDDNRKITYNLTLYGGLGEFFYSLSYNEDGSAKTLKDIYYNWRPKTTLAIYGDAMSVGEEMTSTLLHCSSSIIAQSYHNLNPYYTYEGTTDIDKDIVFVPCYTGLYNDFDSKHMLVSTFNQHYVSAPLAPEAKANLLASFPDRVDENGDITTSDLTPSSTTIYSTLDAQYSSSGAYRYGLATFSRDLDPTEAGDLRVNELPVAIRLSKLLWAITRPDNCGGYEVEWSKSIANSLPFLYGWVLLGKLNTTFDSISATEMKYYEIGNKTLTYSEPNQGQSSTTTNDNVALLYSSALDTGEYIFKLEIKPKFTLQTLYQQTEISYNDWGMMSYYSRGTGAGENRQFWARYNVYVVFTKFIVDSVVKSFRADVFFYSTYDVYKFGVGDPFHNSWEYVEALKAKLANYMQQDIDDIVIHNLKPHMASYTNNSGHLVVNEETEPVNIDILFNNTGSLVRIEQQTTLAFIQWGKQAQPIVGIWGQDNPYNSTCPFNLSFFGQYKGDHTTWAYDTPPDDYTFTFETLNVGLFLRSTAGFNIVDLDKKTLFASSSSPFKYLVDFCKMMNYKFICDNTKKHIDIVTNDEYYKDSEIDLTNKVDYKRQINVKPVIAKNKIIDIGLQPLDTYPIELLNRKLTHSFNKEPFDTGLEYSSTNTTLLDNLIYKSTSDWQLNSIFYNLWSQYPKPYCLPTVSWTLFNYTSAKLDKKEFIFTTSDKSQKTQTQALDWMPKIGLFDKSSKYVDGTTLLFLNGFVKNYDYAPIGKIGESNYAIVPRLSFSNDTIEQYYLNDGKRCYISDFKYNDNFTSWGCYSSDQKGTASSWVLPMFSRDLYNIYVQDIQAWNNTAYKMASWNLVNQDGLDNVCNLSNTTFIYRTDFTFTKTTTSETWRGNEYTIPSTNIVADSEGDTMRIYDVCWSGELEDIYHRNSREVTLYVDLTKMTDPNYIMRQTYLWEGSKWIITKIHNFKLSNFMKDKFTKVTMKKIVDIDNWITNKLDMTKWH